MSERHEDAGHDALFEKEKKESQHPNYRGDVTSWSKFWVSAPQGDTQAQALAAAEAEDAGKSGAASRRTADDLH